MSEHEEPDDVSRRPSGRRAAPASRVGTMLEPALPYVAASVAWLSRHRLGAMIAATGLAVVVMGAAGVALMQAPGGGAPGNEASTSIGDPRPTSTTPAAPSPYGPVLPTPVPPTPVPTPTPTTAPDEIVEPPVDDEPVEPIEPTATPEDPDDHPGQGKGPKKPR
ncbi:hypothetical protein JOE59_002664 [Agromyces cerinus]|uniref:hypothetical protein n=1 Tax=Agromyces cerinus TaxID=33878 RepID=UPI00195DF092|nr:hypothetical protein [Agromyces cerinus]MBM7831959.1 hypothetical protein [Agromyces cerinus]